MKIGMEFPVIGSYDVVVCGGGVSGFVAAVSAARNHARTAIVEQYGFIGGTATAGLVTPITDIRHNGQPIIGGIPMEFINRMADAGMAENIPSKHNVCFDQEYYKLTAQEMLVESGVHIYYHTYVTGVCRNDDHISHILVARKSGNAAIAAKEVIDCTGDADIAYSAGVPMLPGESLQPMTLWLKLGGVDTEYLEAEKKANQSKRKQLWRVHERLAELQKSGECPMFGGPWVFTSFHRGIVNLNITRVSANSADADEFSKAEITLRKNAYELLQILRDNFAEFKDAYILETAPQACARESRRIRGCCTVSIADLLEQTHYEDSVCMGGHCIDIHQSNSSEQKVFFLEKPYFIPYRCMITNEIDNLFVAGRCVSADKQSQATMRVQASCMAEGEAVGCAAAMCATYGIGAREIDIAELRRRLADAGVIL